MYVLSDNMLVLKVLYCMKKRFLIKFIFLMLIMQLDMLVVNLTSRENVRNMFGVTLKCGV